MPFFKLLFSGVLEWIMGKLFRPKTAVEQQNADLKAQNEVLRKQRDSLAKPKPENPFEDGRF